MEKRLGRIPQITYSCYKVSALGLRTVGPDNSHLFVRCWSSFTLPQALTMWVYPTCLYPLCLSNSIITVIWSNDDLRCWIIVVNSGKDQLQVKRCKFGCKRCHVMTTFCQGRHVTTNWRSRFTAALDMMFIHYFISPECLPSQYNTRLYRRDRQWTAVQRSSHMR